MKFRSSTALVLEPLAIRPSVALGPRETLSIEAESAVFPAPDAVIESLSSGELRRIPFLRVRPGSEDGSFRPESFG